MKERRSHQRAKSNTSLNCSFESNTSINCPVESNTSSNCPDESNTFINCPKESDTSINCSKGSNNSKNCLEEGNTSLKCPKLIEKQKWNQKTKKSIESTETCKLNRKRSSDKMMWNLNTIPSSLKQRKVDRNEMRNLGVPGTFHQGDTRFGWNSEKQCVANSLSGIAHSKLKKCWWVESNTKGNEIYTLIHESNGLLLMFDLPEMLQLSGKILNIRKKDSITATINSDESVEYSAFGSYLPLDRAIQESLTDADGCIICVVEYFFMIMKHDQGLYIFDSHSRNGFGLIDPNGKSLLMQLRDINHLYEYCCIMVHSVVPESQWFAVTNVNVYVIWISTAISPISNQW